MRHQFLYDGRRRVLREHPPTGPTNYTYNPDGRLTSRTDPLGRVTSYVRDQRNWLATVTEAVGVAGLQRTTTTLYDVAANLVHEVVVVDTGSCDGTRAVATQHGARVYDIPWTGCSAKNIETFRASCVTHEQAEERPRRDDGDQLADSGAQDLAEFDKPLALARRNGDPLGELDTEDLGLDLEGS